MSLLIQNGDLILPGGRIETGLDVRLRGEKIAEIGRGLSLNGEKTFNADGMLVTPSLIDMHVHLRDPGQTHKETLETGGQAAAAGGFTQAVCMANTDPALDSPELIIDLLKRAETRCPVDIRPVGAITLGINGERPAPYDALLKAGVCAFSDDGKSAMDEGIMRRLLKKSARRGFPVLVHCEDPLIAGEGVINSGETAKALGVPGIPPSAEEAVVARDARLCLETGGRLHIQHLTTRAGVEIVRRAKALGANMTAEACPHHFALDDSAVLTHGADAKMNPPLRTRDDMDALIEGLADGAIDAIATDHAPHSPDEKARGLLDAPFGVIGLELCVPLVWTHLVLKGKLSAVEAVDKMTRAPAEILRLPVPSLEIGAPADIAVIDPHLEIAVSGNEIFSKSGNTPFMGARLRGWPVLTVRRGTALFQRS